MSNLDALVLIPSYEPEETLINLSRGLSELGFKVLIVNDGSGPTYQDIFIKASKYAEVIGYDKNQGKGIALKFGFKHIQKNYKDVNFVITADGDGQHRIKDIERIYQKAKKKDSIVIGERKFDVKVPIKSKIGNDLSKFTQSIATYRYLSDNQCGLRAFPTRYLNDVIKVGGSRYEYEMKVLSYLQTKEINFETIQIQTIYENNNANTHFRPIADTLLIQQSLIVLNLLNIFLCAFQATMAFLFSTYIFAQNDFKYEIAISIAFLSSLILEILLKTIIYRPKSFKRLILRVVLYQLLIFVAVTISVTLFTRVLNLSIFLSYLFCYLLITLPLYYMIKGVGLVYGSHNSDDDL